MRMCTVDRTLIAAMQDSVRRKTGLLPLWSAGESDTWQVGWGWGVALLAVARKAAIRDVASRIQEGFGAGK